MTYIHSNACEKVGEEAVPMFVRHQRHYGYIPNYLKVFVNRPEIMNAWSALQATIRTNLSEHDYELITLAAAMELNNSYCSLAHGKVLLDKFYNEEELYDIVCNCGRKVLIPVQQKMMALARKVVSASHATTEQDFSTLKEEGCSDDYLFDIVCVASARCFFGKIADALGAQPDVSFRDMSERFTTMFTLGRSISNEGIQTFDQDKVKTTVNSTGATMPSEQNYYHSKVS